MASEHMTGADRAEAGDHERLKPRVVYEVVRSEGEAEIARPTSSLWWSGLAAGFAISMSVVSEALLRQYLPDAGWRPLVDNLGYTIGFLIVILGRVQLFTENTITAVLPVLAKRDARTFAGAARLWGVVLLANVVGAIGVGLLLAHGGVIGADTLASAEKVSLHFTENSATALFLKGIPAGFLIAALVWMLVGSEANEFWIVVAITYIIALGDFAHVIAGSVEIALLVWRGLLSPVEGLVFDFVPTLLGNIVGGTGLFALLAWAQVRAEVDEGDA